MYEERYVSRKYLYPWPGTAFFFFFFLHFLSCRLLFCVHSSR